MTALQKADLLITLGARFDDSVTGRRDTFAPGAAVIHVDIDPAEIGKNRRADVPVVGDLRTVLRQLNACVRAEFEAGRRADLTAWWRQVDNWSETYPLGYEAQSDGSLAPHRSDGSRDHAERIALAGRVALWTGAACGFVCSGAS